MKIKRPALWATLFTICGIYFRLGVSRAICLVLFILAVFLISCFVKKRQWNVAIGFLFIMLLGFFVAGQQGGEPHISLDERSVSDWEGIIYDQGITSTGNQKLFLRVEEPSANSEVESLNLYAVYSGSTSFHIGDILQFSGEILPLEEKSVPGGYDEKLYLHTKKIDYKIYPEEIVKVGEKAGVAVFFQKQKEKVFEVFDTVFSQKESGIVKAMVTGEKGYIQQEVRDLYIKAGINHILCVSGLHVSLFALFLHLFFVKCLKRSKRTAASITIGCCIGFLLFTGFSPSSVRAVIMIIITLLGAVLYRKSDWLNSLAIAGLIILLFQPLYLWNAGFQLSFVTALGIWVGLQVMPKEKSKVGKVKQSAVLSLYASLFSYPLVAYHFFHISLVGMLVNILVLPFCGVLLFFAFFTAVAGVLFPPLAAISAGGVYGILKFYELICTIAVSIPYSYVLIGAPSILTIFLFYSMLFLYSFYGKRFCNSKSILCIVFLLGFSIFGNRLFLHKNTIAFLDVGQGDAAVISTYDGRAIVIDGGGWFGVDIGKNTGVNIVQPYLEYLGIDELDGIFLTHFDSDHMLGVIELCQRVPTKGLYMSEYPYSDTECWDMLKEVLEKQDIMLYTVKEGDTATWGNEGEIVCLYPPANVKFLGNEDNHGSLVLNYVYGGIKVLFTGDATIEDEKVILAKGMDISANILKLGHHGSKYSSSDAFLEEVSPKVGVVSCGKDNVYGHPHQETLQRLQEKNITVYRTDKQGTVIAQISPKGTTVVEGVSERESVYERIKKTMEKR